MANDQFTIPGQGEESLNEALRIADSLRISPERHEGVFGRIKAVEERIHGYRRTALEIESNRKPALLENLFGVKRQKVTLTSLIEQESRIGGSLFGPNDRFWLSHKGSSALSNAHDIGDWYHSRDIYDQFGRKTGEVSIHFETHQNRIVKLVNGRPVEPVVTELETLVSAIELVEPRVREQLYPFDQEIFDLLTEIDDENFVVPDSVEEMFGKEIVARVVAQYRAQKMSDTQT